MMLNCADEAFKTLKDNSTAAHLKVNSTAAHPGKIMIEAGSCHLLQECMHTCRALISGDLFIYIPSGLYGISEVYIFISDYRLLRWGEQPLPTYIQHFIAFSFILKDHFRKTGIVTQDVPAMTAWAVGI